MPISSARCASRCGLVDASPRESARARAKPAPSSGDYFNFGEALTKLPSHRILALFRGEKEEVLDLAIEPESTATAQTGSSPYELRIMHRFAITDRGRP